MKSQESISKWKATMINKYGSEEAFKAKWRASASKGGKRTVNKGLSLQSKEVRSEIARMGGIERQRRLHEKKYENNRKDTDTL